MPAVKIVHTEPMADRAGLHQPGDVIASPSPELLALAQKDIRHPQLGTPLVVLVSTEPGDVIASPSPQIAADAQRQPAEEAHAGHVEELHVEELHVEEAG